MNPKKKKKLGKLSKWENEELLREFNKTFDIGAQEEKAVINKNRWSSN